MPPETRFVTRFAAEPPQGPLPTGRWAATLQAEFLAACLRIDAEGEDLGEPGEIQLVPGPHLVGPHLRAGHRAHVDRLRAVRLRLLPARRRRRRRAPTRSPSDFESSADFTTETAEQNPDWKLDLCEEVIGGWRGEQGHRAAMTLVWGRPLVRGGAIVTAELADLAVDQCALLDDRFTLIAPDDYRGDYLDIKLFSVRGERARVRVALRGRRRRRGLTVVPAAVDDAVDQPELRAPARA